MSAINYGIDIEKFQRKAGDSEYAPRGKAYLTINDERTSSSKLISYTDEMIAYEDNLYKHDPEKSTDKYVVFSIYNNSGSIMRNVYFDIPVQLGGKSNARRKASAIKTGPKGGKYIIKNGRKCYIK